MLLAGVYFGILQSALYFSILVYVTATYFGYFVMMISWMLGTVFFMRKRITIHFGLATSISIVLYLLFLAITWKIGSDGFSSISVLVVPVLIFLIAISSGTFFKAMSAKSNSTSIFFHENNGFVLGMIIELLCFVKWGIYALYFPPLIAFVFVIVSNSANHFVTIGFFLTVLVFLLKILSQEMIIVILILAGLALLVAFIKEKKSSEPNEEIIKYPVNTVRIILFISGFNLIYLQNYITRAFSNILSANELTIFIVAIAYFIGFSVGYALNRKISVRMIILVLPLIFLLHITVFLFVEDFVATVITMGYGSLLLYGILIFISLLTSSVYSILLPKLIQKSGERTLTRAYTWDLIGAMSAVITSIFFVWYYPQAILPVYLLGMLLLLHIFSNGRRSRWIITSLGLVIVFIFTLTFQDYKKRSTEKYFEARGYDHSELIFSKNSFYHSVDVIDTHKDQNKKTPNDRISFINGVPFFTYKYKKGNKLSGETSLSEFTYYLAELPAKYMHERLGRKLRILILGGGSIYSIQRVSKYSEKTTLVEIDPVIVESSKQCWSELNRWDVLDNYEIIIDDAKHYLKKTDEKFDLIIMDISAPYYLGTALLHNRDFYKIIREKLSDDGIFAESTQGRPKSNAIQSVPLKILKGIADVYPNYVVVDCRLKPRGQRGFVYASMSQKFDDIKLEQIMQMDGMRIGVFQYFPEDERFNLEDTTPYSLTNMENLLSWNKNLMKSRLGMGD